MRIINILGVTLLYLPIFIRYGSLRGLFVFINGILYHSNENIFFLRYYDILCNILMIIFTVYNDITVWPYLLYSIFNYLLNNYMFQINFLSLINSDFFHVFMVQLPLSLCLFKIKSKSS